MKLKRQHHFYRVKKYRFLTYYNKAVTRISHDIRVLKKNNFKASSLERQDRRNPDVFFRRVVRGDGDRRVSNIVNIIIVTIYILGILSLFVGSTKDVLVFYYV